MIHRLDWHKVPKAPLIALLPEVKWVRGEGATATSALMLYMALVFAYGKEKPTGFYGDQYIKSLTYDDFEQACGISRKLISSGLKLLAELKLVDVQGGTRSREYEVIFGGSGWFKLPCRSIVANNGQIRPFNSFQLRSKHELHALKLHLYLASVRDNSTAFSLASYETIYARTAIIERDIRKAIALLINCGLMVNVTREKDVLVPYGPNHYFLNGHEKLFGKQS